MVEAEKGCDENGSAAGLLLGHVSIQICCLVASCQRAHSDRKAAVLVTDLKHSYLVNLIGCFESSSKSSSRQPRNVVGRSCLSAAIPAQATSRTRFGSSHWIFSLTFGGFKTVIYGEKRMHSPKCVIDAFFHWGWIRNAQISLSEQYRLRRHNPFRHTTYG